MTVGELIELLQQYDEDAEVKSMQQPSWPFEYSIAGVVSRDEFRGRDEDEDHDTKGYAEAGTEYDEKPSDVFILEGTQLCYGSKSAWDAT